MPCTCGQGPGSVGASTCTLRAADLPSHAADERTRTVPASPTPLPARPPSPSRLLAPYLEQLHHVLVQQEDADGKLRPLAAAGAVQWVLHGPARSGRGGVTASVSAAAKQRALGGLLRRPAAAVCGLLCRGALRMADCALGAAGGDGGVRLLMSAAQQRSHCRAGLRTCCCASPGAGGGLAIQDAGLGAQQAQRVAERHAQIVGQPARAREKSRGWSWPGGTHLCWPHRRYRHSTGAHACGTGRCVWQQVPSCGRPEPPFSFSKCLNPHAPAHKLRRIAQGHCSGFVVCGGDVGAAAVVKSRPPDCRPQLNASEGQVHLLPAPTRQRQQQLGQAGLSRACSVVRAMQCEQCPGPVWAAKPGNYSLSPLPARGQGMQAWADCYLQRQPYASINHCKHGQF